MTRYLLLLLAALGLAACDSVEKACGECCNAGVLQGICVTACVKGAEATSLQPNDVRRVCPGR